VLAKDPPAPLRGREIRGHRYGKLGGKELGYASDLDLVFLYEDEDQSAARTTPGWPSASPPGCRARPRPAPLFETDLRLRPNGDPAARLHRRGLPRVPAQACLGLGTPGADPRPLLAGDPAVGARFDAIRQEVLTQQRDPAKLKEEVLAMRQRMLDSHASNSETEFDLKQDPGGIIDVEFIVQFLILAHAHQHPQLTKNLGNIALLGIAADLGLIATELADPVRNAYREYRRMQHAARLNGNEKSRIERAAVIRRVEAVRQLWQTVFGS
jgi:glutamate-ammonia-ligase adenylyltransferase